MVKNVVKLAGFGIFFVILAAGIIYGIGYWKYKNSPEYRAEKDLKNLEKKYAEDTYGGDTPEETLRLFVAALKNGDIDLAAKYFILDKQKEWKEDLAKIKEKNLLGEMIKDLESTKFSSDDDVAYFTLTRENDYPSQLVMHKNPLNNKWKITEL